jgi:hypothetical protein
VIRTSPAIAGAGLAGRAGEHFGRAVEAQEVLEGGGALALELIARRLETAATLAKSTFVDSGVAEERLCEGYRDPGRLVPDGCRARLPAAGKAPQRRS